MNAKKFSDAMSELDTKYVEEALNYKKKAKKYFLPYQPSDVYIDKINEFYDIVLEGKNN